MNVLRETFFSVGFKQASLLLKLQNISGGAQCEVYLILCYVLKRTDGTHRKQYTLVDLTQPLSHQGYIQLWSLVDALGDPSLAASLPQYLQSQDELRAVHAIVDNRYNTWLLPDVLERCHASI